MKNIVIAILCFTVVLAAGLYIHETHKANQAFAKADSLQQNITDLQSALDEKDRRIERLRRDLDDARLNVMARVQDAVRAAQLQPTAQASAVNLTARSTASETNATAKAKTNPLAEMFKNPEMKEMIKTQQKAVLGTMMDKSYGKLFSDLHLTPEQTASLKDIILNKQLDAAGIGMSMLGGDMDSTKREEMVQQMKTSTDAADAQIKQLLGEENFAQYQAYEKTIGERMSISGFKDQLGSGPTALTGTQEEQLVQAMTQERQNFKFTTDFSDKSKFTGDFGSMFTEDKLDTYFQELEQLDQQYLSRAQTILSQDQLSAFSKHLTGQKALQKAGMQMAMKMFGSGKSGE